MRLLDLHIDGFGKFHNLTLTFDQGLNIIYGKNEAGKSTIHTYIRSMLFGLERGRGRAARNDLYTRYEPWSTPDIFKGNLRFEHQGKTYRIQRNFSRSNRDFSIVNETEGQKLSNPQTFLNEVLCGLTETAYNNTISISQLKCPTDSSMTGELKNYIANMNNTGNLALNISKATNFLKNQRRALESKTVPDATQIYTSLLGEIRNLEKELAAPEYQNRLAVYQEKKDEITTQISQKQKERESDLQMLAKNRQILSTSRMETRKDIQNTIEQTEQDFQKYNRIRKAYQHSSQMVLPKILIGGSIFCAIAAIWLITRLMGHTVANPSSLSPYLILAFLIAAGVFGLFLGLMQIARYRDYAKRYKKYSTLLSGIFQRYLNDPDVSDSAMEAFQKYMGELLKTSDLVSESEVSVKVLAESLGQLKDQELACHREIEQQQRSQWEMEKKLEYLASCNDKADALKRVITENDRLEQEIAAIDLAQETMTQLASNIRNSFGLYLNKEASQYIDGITHGIYNSMSIDENLNVQMNTKNRLVPIEQVSTGTADQIYLALRLASARLIQGEDKTDQLPLFFDDSFVLYDEDRLHTAMEWLLKSYHNQIIIFTCHQREAHLLTTAKLPFHLITIDETTS